MLNGTQKVLILLHGATAKYIEHIFCTRLFLTSTNYLEYISIRLARFAPDFYRSIGSSSGQITI